MFKPKNINCTIAKSTPVYTGFVFLLHSEPGQKTEKPSIKKYFDPQKEQLENQTEINTPHIKYTPDANQNIREVAKSAFEDEKEAEKYASKIKASLEKYLLGGVTIDQFWIQMEKEFHCTSIAIRKGILQFFKEEMQDGQVKEVEIQIRQFLRPFEIPATSRIDKALDSSWVQAKNDVMANTAKELGDLLRQMRNRTPNLPPPPSSILS